MIKIHKNHWCVETFNLGKSIKIGSVIDSVGEKVLSILISNGCSEMKPFAVSHDYLYLIHMILYNLFYSAITNVTDFIF